MTLRLADPLDPQGQTKVPLGAGRSVEVAESERWDTFDSEMAALEQRGIHALEEPNTAAPHVSPDALLTRDRAEFTRLATRLNAWYGYLADYLAYIAAELVGLENEDIVLSARLRRQLRVEDKATGAQKGKKGRTAQEVADIITTDTRLVELRLRMQGLTQRKLVVAARLDGIERSLRIVSRQVEINRQELEGNRTAGAGGGGAPRPNRAVYVPPLG